MHCTVINPLIFNKIVFNIASGRRLGLLLGSTTRNLSTAQLLPYMKRLVVKNSKNFVFNFLIFNFFEIKKTRSRTRGTPTLSPLATLRRLRLFYLFFFMRHQHISSSCHLALICALYFRLRPSAKPPFCSYLSIHLSITHRSSIVHLRDCLLSASVIVKSSAA